MKKRFFLHLCLLVVIVGTAVANLPLEVEAQAATDTESITLSPVSRKYQVDAGQSVHDEMTVVNDGSTDYDFIVYGRPYSVKNDSYEPDFTKVTPTSDAYAWVQFSQVTYHLKAGQTMTVPFTMTVPAGAAPGGHYGVLFAETQPANTASGAASVTRKKRVGMLLYVTVKGTYRTAGSVQNTSIPFWQVSPPLSASSLVNNTGNTDITDDTVMVVKDVFGGTKFSQTKQYTVLPNAPREIPFVWPGASWFGLYQVALTQTVLGKVTTTTSYVLIMPRALPIIVLIIVLAGSGYAWFHRRKMAKK